MCKVPKSLPYKNQLAFPSFKCLIFFLQLPLLCLIFLRSAAHCFCADTYDPAQRGYCTQEYYDGTHVMAGGPVQIFLGMMDRKLVRDVVTHEIQSVRVPRERIAMYARGETVGPHDIALVKTREKVVFIAGKIMPVGYPL